MGQRWHLANSEQLDNFRAYVGQMWLAGKRPTVEFLPDKRSLSQNDLIHALYREIAAQAEDERLVDIVRYCKLHHGVPILRAADDAFREFYDTAVKGLEYEQKLKAMDFLPVTSRMSTEQASQYVEAVSADYFSRGFEIEGTHG